VEPVRAQDDSPGAAAEEEAPTPKRRKQPAAVAAHSNGEGAAAAETLRVSPIARRMADQAGIDLRPMAGRGSGPEGRIVKADVERLLGGATGPAPASAVAPAAAPAGPQAAEVRDLTPLLKAVPARRTQS